MRFLAEAYRRRRKRVRLEQLALLTARCLLVAALAFGVAVPLLGGGPGTLAPRTLVLVLDDSIASGLTDDSGRTDRVRSVERARGLLADLDPARGDRVGLIAAAAPAVPLLWPPTGDLAAARAALDRMATAESAADSGADFAAALSIAASGAASGAAGADIVVLSAFRAGSVREPPAGPAGPADTAESNAESAAQAQTAGVRSLRASAPAPGTASNVAVVALRPARDDLIGLGDEAALTLARVTLRRDGPGLDAAARRTVQLFVEGRSGLLAQSVAVWEPGQRQTQVSLPFDERQLPAAAGAVVLRARVVHDAEPDALEADDVAWSTLDRRRSIRAGVVARESGGGAGFSPADFARAALRPTTSGGVIEPIETDPRDLTPAAAAAFDALVILDPDQLSSSGWQAAAAIAQRGGVVVLTPPAGDASPAWTDVARETLGLRAGGTAQEIGQALAVAPAGADTLPGLASDLPELSRAVSVTRRVPIETGDGGDALLTTADGAPWLVLRPLGRGRVALLASAIDPAWTNLPARPLIVPLLQELARLGLPQDASARGIAGRSTPAPPGWRALAPRTPNAAAPAITGGVVEPARHAGLHDAIGTDARRGPVLVISPDAQASLPDPVTPEQAAQWLARAAARAGVRVSDAGSSDAADSPPIEWLDDRQSADAASANGPGAFGAGTPRDGTSLAWLAFVAALALGVLELGLARRASHAERAE